MATASGCTSPSSPTESSFRRAVTIGIPESGVNAADLGIGSFISNSSLEGLTDLNGSPDGHPLPRLAETWTWESNGRQLRLKLRQGVLFHDGTPLTPEIASRALTAAIARAGNRALYPSLPDITSIRPDGPSHITIELSQPSAFLTEELDFPIAIGDGTIGTGPFRLVKRDDSSAVLQRFDEYYLGRSNIEQITVRPFDTLRTAWTSLLRGDLDVVTDVPPDAVEFVQNDAIQVIPFARRYQFLIAFNSQSRPFASGAVRRALNVAVDRDALITNVLQGQGRTATGPLWPQHWAYDNSVQPYRFDPEFAVSLLENAGFSTLTEAATDRPPARLHFTCLLPANFSLLERIGLEIQKQLFDVGVDMQFEVVSLPEYDSRIREKQFEAVLVDLSSGPTIARANVFWRPAKRAVAGLNLFGYDNAEAERLFALLGAQTNEAATRSATRRLQQVMLEDPPALFLAWNARARAIRRNFRVVGEPGRDPLLSIRLWTENTDSPPVSTQ